MTINGDALVPIRENMLFAMMNVNC